MLALSLLVLAASPQEVEKQTLPDGTRVEYEVRVDAGADTRVPDGEYRAIAASGQRLAEGKLADGRPRSRWRFRYADGELRASGSYRDGERSGTWTFSRPDGAEWGKGKFSGGHADGNWVFRAPGGAIDARHSGEYDWVEGRRAAGPTLDGRPHGLWTFRTEEGAPLARAILRSGVVIARADVRLRDGTPAPELDFGSFTGSGLPAEFLQAPAIPGIDGDPGDPGDADPAPVLPARTPLAQPPGLDLETWSALESALDEVLAGEVQDEQRATLANAGVRAIPAVVNRLVALDLDDRAQADSAARLFKLAVAPILGPEAYGWRDPKNPESVVAARRALLRADTLLSLLIEDELFWTVEVPLARGILDSGWELEVPVLHHLLPAQKTRRSAARRRVGAGMEQAMVDGLAWLVEHQASNGSWDPVLLVDEHGLSAREVGDKYNAVGITSLALLALIGNGNALTKGPYQENVRLALRWLLPRFNRKTGLLGEERGHAFLYSHALATRALCQLAAASDSRVLRVMCQRAVGYAVRARNPYGAWRYDVPPQGDNDTSVTTLMVLALLEGEALGAVVPADCYKGAINWVDEVTDAATGRVGYDALGGLSARIHGVNDHYPPELSEAMTAAGLLLRLRLGQDPEEVPILGQHAELILKTLPDWSEDGFANDLYYWYYGTHAMYQLGGKAWSSWNKAIKPALLDSQRQDDDERGSWDPDGPWGFSGGRVYSTSMALLCMLAYGEERVLAAK